MIPSGIVHWKLIEINLLIQSRTNFSPRSRKAREELYFNTKWMHLSLIRKPGTQRISQNPFTTPARRMNYLGRILRLCVFVFQRLQA
jgi:hypothetical protein